MSDESKAILELARSVAAASERLAGAIERLATATLRISHGTESGPTGLEMLAMSIAGEGPGWPGIAQQLAENGVGVMDQSTPEAIDNLGATIRSYIEAIKEP